MDRIPKFVYGAGPTTLTLTRPSGPYRRGLRGHGAGYAESAALVPSVWVTTWDHTFMVPLRLFESEWPDVRDFMMHALQGLPFDIYPNANDTVNYTVTLVSPRIDELIVADLQDYFTGETLDIVVRRTDLLPIDFEYFDG